MSCNPAPSTPLLSPTGLSRDSAEPNLVLRVDGGTLPCWDTPDCIYEREPDTQYDSSVLVIRCKNEREGTVVRKVGGIGNVSAELTFTGFGDRLFIPADLGAWLSDGSERVQFPVGVTHRVIVARLTKTGKLYLVQRRSHGNKTIIWERELDGDYCRLRVALYAETERKPLVKGDYILEKDGNKFHENEMFAGPQLVSTSLWRHSQITKRAIQAYGFSKLDYDNVPREQFDADYTTWETDTAEFIARHYGEGESREFTFTFEPPKNTGPLAFRRVPPTTFRERIDKQIKQLDRLDKQRGL